MSDDASPAFGGASPGGASTADAPSEGASPRGPSLEAPRPHHQRKTNVYVDTPFQHRVAPTRLHRPHRPPPEAPNRPSEAPSLRAPEAPLRVPVEFPLVHGPLTGSQRKETPNTPCIWETPLSKSIPSKPQGDGGVDTPNSATSISIVSSQPTTFTKSSPASVYTLNEEEESIVCGRCGRCRCEACASPRPPAGVWLCGGKCHLSPVTAVDYASCLCCVRGVLYHCGRDTDEGVGAVDRPCSCIGKSEADKCLRWGCLALASIPLPCLLCYWPLTGLRKVCESVYMSLTTNGCRCHPPKHTSIRQQTSASGKSTPTSVPPKCNPISEKRLLNDCMT